MEWLSTGAEGGRPSGGYSTEPTFRTLILLIFETCPDQNLYK